MCKILGFSLVLFFTATLPMSAQAQERQWSLEPTEKEVFLVFGVPDTSDVGFSLWCDVSKKTYSIFAATLEGQVKRDEKSNVTLTIDGKSSVVKAKATIDAATGNLSLEGKLPKDQSFLDDMAKGEILTVKIKSHTATFPLADADVAGLKRNCEGDAN